MPRTAILSLAALLMPLAACTVNSPREPAPEPPPPASPAEPSEPPTTATPTTQAPTTQAPTAQAPTAQAPTTQAPTTQAPTMPATTASPSGDDALLGTWRSAACGARKYERVLSFTKDGSFAAEDRVSPCPPKVACIWSGIIHRKGAFKRSDNTLSLSVADASQGPGGQAFPVTLTVDAATGAPVETGEGGKPCPYQR